MTQAPQPYILRPYQKQTISLVRVAFTTHRRVVLVLPTGSGKTVIGAAVMALSYAKGARCLFLVHREELLLQAAEKIQAAALNFGVIKAGYKEARSHAIQIASVQTLNRRAMPRADLVICDEAHRRDHAKITKHYPEAFILGLTATPERMGGQRLTGEYDFIVQGTSYSELLQAGYIVPARVFAPPPPSLAGVGIKGGDWDPDQAARVMLQRHVTGGIVSNWTQSCAGATTIAYASNIAHANALTSEFQAHGARAEVVTGETPREVRASILDLARRGTIQVVVNVGVFTEGLDLPEARVIIMARPTLSLPLYMQMAGRGCRPLPGKTEYRIYDHAANVYFHGAPDRDRPWSLEGRPQRKSTSAAKHIRSCPRCHYVYATGAGVAGCPMCGHRATPRITKYVAGTLQEVDPATVDICVQRLSAAQREKARLEIVARKYNLSRAWIDRKLASWHETQAQKMLAGSTPAEDLW